MNHFAGRNNQNWPAWRWIGVAVIPAAVYLAAAWSLGYAGFPLDDAWIHQTYARNLAETGQFAFTPGLTSAGSTAPLWTVLLSVGYLLGIPFKVWAYGLGTLFLGLTGFSVQRLAARLFPARPGVGLWAGLFCVVEWHLVWAAVSGMETMLFVWLSVLLVERHTAHRTDGAAGPAFGLGLIGGALALTRPEGIGLLGLVGLDVLALNLKTVNGPTIKQLAALAAGALLLLLPYVLFHLHLTGLPFPNTLYAKQAEYGIVLQSFPLWQRLFGGFGPPVDSVQGVFRVIFIGPMLLLLPGLAVAAWHTVKERRTELWLIWAWWLSYLLLYGLRLPVTYQHGRYQIPVIVWAALLGVWGTARLAVRQPGQSTARRVLGRVLVVSAGVLAAAFVLVGAQAYARDVRIIETEMVATAHWLAQNMPPDGIIAAHDIGAIGYFTRRPLIDLAGLVTPEIIPIIRNEPALLEFVQSAGAETLVTFPGWYPELTQDPALSPLYRTGSPFARQAGGENMAVYRVAKP